MTARRGAIGEGTIYRRKDGRWEGAAFLRTASGGRKRVSFYGRTRAEAYAKLIEAKAQSQKGIPVPDQTWRLGPYLDHWLDNAVRTKRRALTFRRHSAVVRLYIKPHLATQTLSQLSVQTVQTFLDQLHADGKSVASVHQIRKVLSAALTYAVRMELLPRNVARLVELPSYAPNEAEHWTPDEARKFLAAAKSDPLHPVFVLLVLYGLRRGEVLGLRWCDIDFSQQILRVRQQVQRIEGDLRQVELKTRSSRRDEPLLPTATEMLRAQQSKQESDRKLAGSNWQGTGDHRELVFTTRSGRPIESRNVYRSFLRICAEHELRRITLHGLRHTNATTQKSLQVHDRDIQAILGHGDVRTTGIYAHVDMDSKRNALGKVEGKLFLRTTNGDLSRRQLLPSRHQIARNVTEFFFGVSSQTRTGDTRLFSKFEPSVNKRLTTVRHTQDQRRRQWICGAIAVSRAVNRHQAE